MTACLLFPAMLLSTDFPMQALKTGFLIVLSALLFLIKEGSLAEHKEDVLIKAENACFISDADDETAGFGSSSYVCIQEKVDLACQYFPVTCEDDGSWSTDTPDQGFFNDHVDCDGVYLQVRCVTIFPRPENSFSPFEILTAFRSFISPPPQPDFVLV